MRKLFTFFIALAAVAGVTASSFGGSMMLMGAGKAPAAGGSPVFTFRGSDGTNSGTLTFTSTTTNIGSSTSDRYVIIALVDQNGVGLSSVTCNGVSLTLDVQELPGADRGMYIWSGLVGTAGGAGTATIVATFNSGAAFTDRTMIVWTGTGMANTTGAAHTVNLASGTTMNISVNAGDFLIAVASAGVTFSGSTQTPTATRSVVSPAPIFTQTSPEWNTIASTNASFAITSSSSTSMAAASYR